MVVAVTLMLSVSTAPVPVAQEKAAPGARDTEFAVVADPLAPGNTNKVSVALTGFSTKHPRRVADAAMADVLAAIAAGCLRNKERHPGRHCQAYLPDLIDPRPPDLPAAAGRRLKLIAGGKQ